PDEGAGPRRRPPPLRREGRDAACDSGRRQGHDPADDGDREPGEQQGGDVLEVRHGGTRGRRPGSSYRRPPTAGSDTIMTTILDTIVAVKRRDVAAAKERTPSAELERRLADAPAARPFRAALERAAGVAVIAEVKKASPSAGVLRAD